jgi:hypothetical protein
VGNWHNEPSRARGRPRSEERRDAVLKAAMELMLEDDLRRASIDRISARSGVSNATIYKWSRTRGCALASEDRDCSHVRPAEFRHVMNGGRRGGGVAPGDRSDRNLPALEPPAGLSRQLVSRQGVSTYRSGCKAEYGWLPRPTSQLAESRSFDIDQPTAWIAEGLLMYLPPEAQNRLLDNIARLSAPGSRIATEQLPDMSAFSDQRSRAWLQRWRQYGLNVDGSELVWDGERSNVGEYLTTNGWRVSVHPAEELYAANGFEFPGDEAVASFGSFDYLIAEMKA